MEENSFCPSLSLPKGRIQTGLNFYQHGVECGTGGSCKQALPSKSSSHVFTFPQFFTPTSAQSIYLLCDLSTDWSFFVEEVVYAEVLSHGSGRLSIELSPV